MNEPSTQNFFLQNLKRSNFYYQTHTKFKSFPATKAEQSLRNDCFRRKQVENVLKKQSLDVAKSPEHTHTVG